LKDNKTNNEIILEIKSGSHLYGTNTSESDVDYQGVFLPSKEYILGIERTEEWNCNEVSKDENGRNTKHAIDRKFYELRKFVNLVMKGNPNIIELCFVNKSNIVQISSLGEYLMTNIKKLISKSFIGHFDGYMRSEWDKYNNPNRTCYKEVKKASHVYRLMSECEELITTGRITFPLQERDVIKEIKNGSLLHDEIDNLLDTKLNKFNLLMENFENNELHPFSKKSCRKLANKLVIDIYEEHLGFSELNND